MKTIDGDLILKEDTVFEESITVKGNIIGDYNLTVNANIDCLDIKCRNIDCWDIKCRNINCFDIDCWNINCFDIDCLDIKGRDIDCWNIDCWDIKCRNINCLDIKCRKINCGNINCGNINCLDINCRDMVFYAVCFAYENIKCKSIKSLRENHKYFVLDGKITIDGVEQK